MVIITACDDIETAVQAMRRGAFDYIVKPLRIPEVIETLDRALQFRDRLDAVSTPLCPGDELIALSPPMRRAVELGLRLAMTNVPVFITGEPATGKSLFARMMHAQSHRRERKFVVVHCEQAGEAAALEALGDASHALGAGAAPGGTIFLHHVDALENAGQRRLLEGWRAATTVGSKAAMDRIARLLASSSVSLAERVEAGRLDAELFHRLSAISIAMPPLRDRSEDLAPLAIAMLGRLAPGREMSIDAAALAAIECHSWPGNGREFEQALRTAVASATDGRIRREHLPAPVRDIRPPLAAIQRSAEALRGRSFAAFLKARERQAITILLRRWNGDRRKVAELLGLRAGELERKMAPQGAGD